MNRNRGASLLEMMVSLLLVVAGFAIVVSLFHTGLRYTVKNENYSVAVQIAEEQMENIRSWTRQRSGGTYNFDDWTFWSGYEQPHPGSPEFTVSVEATDWSTASPCSNFEQDYSEPRQIEQSLKRVTVEVEWKNERLSLTSLVSDPYREWGTPALVISPSTGLSLDPDESLIFNVQATDQDGNPVRDPFFSWYLRPQTGNGTLVETSRDGSSATLTHRLELPDGRVLFAPGNCELFVRSVFNGVEATESVVVEFR